MCAPSESAPCKRVTPFTPRFTARIVLGNDANDANGTKLSASPSQSCSRREHHCTLVIREELAGNLSGDRFVNLVVAAEGNATSKDLMKVEKAHGGVYVTRIDAAANRGGSGIAVDTVATSSMKIDNVDDNNGSGRRESHVLYRARVDNVRPHDLLDLDATINAVVNDGSCDPLIMHQVFVSTDNGDPEATKLLELTAQNGTNCIGANCTFKKSGAGELPGGTPSTVFVTVVAKAGRSCTQNGDTWQIGGGSGVTLRLRR